MLNKLHLNLNNIVHMIIKELNLSAVPLIQTLTQIYKRTVGKLRAILDFTWAMLNNRNHAHVVFHVKTRMTSIFIS